MKNSLTLAALTVLLSGCAAMSVEQCKTANWLNVGEKDGAAGRESRLDQYYSSCQKASKLIIVLNKFVCAAINNDLSACNRRIYF